MKKMLDDSLTKIFTLVSYSDLLLKKLNIEKEKYEIELRRLNNVMVEIYKNFYPIDPEQKFIFKGVPYTYSDLKEYEKHLYVIITTIDIDITYIIQKRKDCPDYLFKNVYGMLSKNIDKEGFIENVY